MCAGMTQNWLHLKNTSRCHFTMRRGGGKGKLANYREDLGLNNRSLYLKYVRYAYNVKLTDWHLKIYAMMLVINKIILNLIVMPSRCSVSPWLHRLVFGVNNYEKKNRRFWYVPQRMIPYRGKGEKGEQRKKKDSVSCRDSLTICGDPTWLTCNQRSLHPTRHSPLFFHSCHCPCAPKWLTLQ